MLAEEKRKQIDAENRAWRFHGMDEAALRLYSVIGQPGMPAWWFAAELRRRRGWR
jgi:hypothetical protein